MSSNFGFNLLKTVQTAIGNSAFQLEPWISSGVNGIGLDVDIYGPIQDKAGNVQPVQRSVYAENGLEFSKEYIDLFSTDLVEVLSRENNSDRIHWNGMIYKAIPNVQWQDWGVIRCVRVDHAG